MKEIEDTDKSEQSCTLSEMEVNQKEIPKNIPKKTSIEQQIIVNAIKNIQKDTKAETNEIPPQKTRHVREGSLFNEILALKNNDIINEQVFEEGFHKINVLNNEMKNWGTQQRVSELDITLPDSKENTLQKPLLINDKNMLRPDENLRNLFKSKQMIAIPHDEKKERKKTVEVNKNPYEEFFILVSILFIFVSVEK